MSSQPDETPYQPKDAVKIGIKGTLGYGAFGLFAAATLAALQRKPSGVFSPFRKFGSIITTCALAGGGYDFARIATGNLRQKDDHLNDGVGGFIGGSIVGLGLPGPVRLAHVIGYGTCTAVALSTFAYTGKSLRGWGQDPAVDEYERKEQMRKNRRRPIEETIAELGEGRGIQAPGYEERRRQRLKEKYGVEINPVCADPDQASPSI